MNPAALVPRPQLGSAEAFAQCLPLRQRDLSTTQRFGLGPWTTHEKVFEDEPLERGIASAAYDLAIRQRACLGTNKLVLGTAVWAVEAGNFWHFGTVADLSEVRQCP